MESYGYTTCNDEGKFEVSWALKESIFTIVFGIKTDFRYVTNSKELKHNKYLSENAGLYYEWFDTDGNRVTCNKTLSKITEVINMVKSDTLCIAHRTKISEEVI